MYLNSVSMRTCAFASGRLSPSKTAKELCKSLNRSAKDGDSPETCGVVASGWTSISCTAGEAGNGIISGMGFYPSD